MTRKKEARVVVQPAVNIGLVGHVDHGKTTLTQALTGRWTDTHSEEVKKGITIRLGYADTIFRKKAGVPEPDAFTVAEEVDGTPTAFVRKVSFVDAPGHESLMATMLSGATIIDGALLLIAANEACPQPQTREHLMALQIIGIKNVVIVQNKIDLVSEQRAKENHAEIRAFVKGTLYEHAPIIPVSARQRVNIDLLIAAIEEVIPTPERDPKASPQFFVARSFDINRPGTGIATIQGGVLGGALKQGLIRKGDNIEIAPGRRVERKGKVLWEPLQTRVQAIRTGGDDVDQVSPGGSVALLTTLDPAVVKADTLTGSIVGAPGKLPPVWYDFSLDAHLLERVVGARESLVVEPIKLHELLMLNVNASATVGTVESLKKNLIQCKLHLPVCAEVGSRVTLSRRLGTRWRLIGYGIIQP